MLGSGDPVTYMYPVAPVTRILKDAILKSLGVAASTLVGEVFLLVSVVRLLFADSVVYNNVFFPSVIRVFSRTIPLSAPNNK